MAPEVLKMLQQMAPTARTASDDDEPDEIKVPPYKVELKLDILCITNTFSINSIRWRIRSSSVPSHVSFSRKLAQSTRISQTYPSSIPKTTLYQP